MTTRRIVAALACVLASIALAGCGQVAASESGPARLTGGVRIWVPPSLAARSAEERMRRIDAWRALLSGVSDLDISLTLPGVEEPVVVVVADARYMSEPELGELSGYLESGGAALVTGWIGALADADAAAGLVRMRGFLRVPSVVALGKDEALYVAIGSRGPLVAGTDPGEKLELGWEERIPALPGAEGELYWARWRLTPVGSDATASLRSERGRGRLVWLAPTPEAAGVSAHTRGRFGAVVRASLAWVGRRPSAELLAWPRGAALAALLAMDTEQGFPAAGHVADLFESIRFPLSFFVLASEAELHRDVLARIARSGEIDSHAERHDGFEGVPSELQLARLRESREALERLGMPAPLAFRPPYESFDEATLRASSEAGFTVFVADKEHRSSAPRLLEIDGRTLVQIPRGVADDFEIFERRHLSTADDVVRVTHVDLEHVRRIGGLYYFSFHTQFFEQPERVSALRALALSARERGAWETTPVELARHWIARSACSASVTSIDASTLRVEVGNRGARSVEALAVRVYTNVPTRRATSDPAGPDVTLRIAPGDEHFDLVLRELPAGSSRTFTIDVEARSPTGRASAPAGPVPR